MNPITRRRPMLPSVLALACLALASLYVAAPTVATAQSDAAGDDAGMAANEYFTTLIPALNVYSPLLQTAARGELIERGPAAINPLRDALRVDYLMQRLYEADALPALRSTLQGDLNQWFEDNSHTLPNSTAVFRLVIAYRQERTNEGLLDGLRAIFAELNEQYAAADMNVEIGPGDVDLAWVRLSPFPTVLNRIRGQAARTLGEMGAVDAADTIATMINETADEARLPAVYALGLLGGVPARVATLESMLFAESLAERTTATSALRRMDSQSTVAMLIGLLEMVDGREATTVPRTAVHAESDSGASVRVIREHVLQALRGLTGRYFNGRTAGWQRWWRAATESGNPLNLTASERSIRS